LDASGRDDTDHDSGGPGRSEASHKSPAPPATTARTARRATILRIYNAVGSGSGEIIGALRVAAGVLVR
jgi:hypothetical protein